MTEKQKELLDKQKRTAKKWLNTRLQKYGNTSCFPIKDQEKLDKYIMKLGNTYFWA